jgi:serine/threonine-protein kinase
MIKNLLRLIIYFFAFVAVGAVASFLIFQLVDVSDTVRAPLIVGKSISEASGLLEDKGVSLVIAGEKYESGTPPDYVISQDVKEGEKIEKGSSIYVVVSSGEAKHEIPYLEGMDMDDVRLTLKKLKMETGRITMIHSDTVEKNRVITQRPLSGYPGESKVNLVVSLGPYIVSYKCPSFLDLTIEEARRLAGIFGLKLVEKDKGSVVILQKPEAGAG